MRYTTLLDAFLTADRRRRGYLPFDRVLEIYSLYFHSAAGQLKDAELAACVEQHMTQAASDGSLVVDYMALASALRKRDQDIARDLSAPADLDAGRHSPLPAASPTLPGTRVEENGLDAPSRRQGRGLSYQSASSSPQPPSPQKQSPPRKASRFATTREPESFSSSLVSTPSPYEQQSSQHSSPLLRGAHGGKDEEETGSSDSVRSLLAALESSDSGRNGRVYAAQLMMMCRMHGVGQSSQVLRTLVSALEDGDGKVDYLAFVQQLLALQQSSLTQVIDHPHAPTRGTLPLAAQRGAALPYHLIASGRESVGQAVLPTGFSAKLSTGANAGGRAAATTNWQDTVLPPAAMSEAMVQLEGAFAKEDALRGRSGRLPVSEVRRLTALYQLKLPTVVIEAALTRASAQDHPQFRVAQNDEREGLIDYTLFLEELMIVLSKMWA